MYSNSYIGPQRKTHQFNMNSSKTETTVLLAYFSNKMQFDNISGEYDGYDVVSYYEAFFRLAAITESTYLHVVWIIVYV